MVEKMNEKWYDKYMFKKVYLDFIISKFDSSKKIRILDLGCGIPNYISDQLNADKIDYTGIEPDQKSYKKALNLFDRDNYRIINSLGYDLDTLRNNGAFDLCISFSVLEHVKDLNAIIRESSKLVRSGGYVIHTYDLGHSLYPSSTKERLQLLFCKLFPQIIPENKFVSYVNSDEIIKLYEKKWNKIY